MVIPTPRLVLRDFEKQDWERVFQYQCHPNFSRFNSWSERTENDVKAFVNRFIDWQLERPRTRFQLAIVLRSEDRLIGNCGIRGAAGGVDAELGFELDSEYWRSGYATEAARAMVEFAFGSLRIPVVRAQCVEENVASARVLERLSMRFSRSEPNALWMKNRWWTTSHYSLTAEHWWKSLRAKTLQNATGPDQAEDEFGP